MERHGGGAYDYRRGLHCSEDTQAAYCRPVLSSGSLGARLRSGQTFTPGLGHYVPVPVPVLQYRGRPNLLLSSSRHALRVHSRADRPSLVDNRHALATLVA